MRSSNYKRNEYIASLLTSSGAAGDGHAITQNKGTKPDKSDVRLLQQYGTYEYVSQSVITRIQTRDDRPRVRIADYALGSVEGDSPIS